MVMSIKYAGQLWGIDDTAVDMARCVWVETPGSGAARHRVHMSDVPRDVAIGLGLEEGDWASYQRDCPDHDRAERRRV